MMGAQMDAPPSGIVYAKLEVRCFYSINEQWCPS
jgi:hypothetical protein